MDQVYEDVLEPMVPIDEGEVERRAVRPQPRERVLRRFLDHGDHVADACLLECLDPGAPISAGLQRVDRNVDRLVAAALQRITDEERRDTESEADLDRPPGFGTRGP